MPLKEDVLGQAQLVITRYPAQFLALLPIIFFLIGILMVYLKSGNGDQSCELNARLIPVYCSTTFLMGYVEVCWEGEGNG